MNDANSMDLKIFLVEFQDYLAPKLDVYEQAIYLYIFRHSRLVGRTDTVIGFRSARHKIALGKGASTTPMSDKSCCNKLQSLQQKGCVKIVGTEHRGKGEHGGTRVELRLPSEILGLIPPATHHTQPDVEEMDFFAVAENRLLIFERENEMFLL